MNKPIVKGEITTGLSTRGGKMIFMNDFAYLYMSTGKRQPVGDVLKEMRIAKLLFTCRMKQDNLVTGTEYHIVTCLIYVKHENVIY
jgi:hypothetical protein